MQINKTTILVVGGCTLLSLALLLRIRCTDGNYNYNHFTCPTRMQGVVKSSCNGCSLLFLALFCLYLMCGNRKEFHGYGKEFVGGNNS